MSVALDQNAKDDLIATIIDESERLNRFIANLLDMTSWNQALSYPTLLSMTSGRLSQRLAAASKILSQHRVEVDLAKDLPMVEIDPVLFEQALFNLWTTRRSMLRRTPPSAFR